MVAIGVGLFLQVASAVSQQREDELLREARSAQERFESVRRINLPRTPSDPGQSCHAHIGRYCFWSEWDEPEKHSDPPPEPEVIVRARDRLMHVLDSALIAIPTNAWLHGQRARYLIEAGRASRARELASANHCGAERWWCAALEGLALHVTERYRAADSVFAIALDSMPPAQRCAWLDLRKLVTRALSREMERATCAEREALAGRLWLLSQPTWTTPGNDLRTEHLARHTMAEIQASSAIAHGMRFADDSRELMVRYGWSEWFTRSDPPHGLSTSPGVRVTGHGREPSFAFFPDVPSLARVPTIAATAWDFRDSLARARYAPRHVRGAYELPHQLARVLRGDSMEITVAYAVTDPRLAHDSLASHIVVLYDDLKRAGTAELTADRARGILRIIVPRDTVIASLEVRGDSTMRVARARYTVAPLACARVCVSDIVLFDGEKRTDSTDLTSALASALTKPRHSVRQPLGVYWEAYGGIDTSGVEVSLMVTPRSPSRMRRIATALRLAREQSPIRLRWRAAPQVGTAIAAESVVLRLPHAARGGYRVVLTLKSPDGTAVTSSREIELTP
jgi:hypothetical protein